MFIRKSPNPRDISGFRRQNHQEKSDLVLMRESHKANCMETHSNLMNKNSSKNTKTNKNARDQIVEKGTMSNLPYIKGKIIYKARLASSLHPTN
jgi:hypothetical protein